MPIVDQLQAYKVQVNADISTQTDPDSITPDLVGSIGVDLADILLGELPKINNFDVKAGAAIPTGGQDTFMYFRGTLSGIEIYRKIGAIWTLLGTIPLGITYPDGILSGLRTSLASNIVTVTPGSWAISNVKYNKNTQTQFTLAAKDVNFDRWDLIYANKLNQILILTGIATLIPVKPTIPVDCLEVDYVYIPAIGSPYLLAGQVVISTTPEPLEALAVNQVADIFTLVWDVAKVNQYGKYGRFLVEQNNTYQQVPITINKDPFTGDPTSYEFNLSSLDSLIHII